MKIKFLTLCTALVIASCSKEDNNSPENTSIIGNWKAISLVSSQSFDYNGDGKESNDLFEELDCFESTTTFSSDGTQNSITSDLTFEGQGDEYVIDCNGTSSYTNTYELVGNILTTTDEEGETISMVTITNNKLTVEGEDDSFGEVTIVFQRQ